MRPNGFSPSGTPSSLPRSRLGAALPFADGAAPSKLVEHADFGENPGALRMFVYVPPSLPKKAPLVVILHGCGQSAADYARGAGWITLADELGFAVLAPEQVRANNMNVCFNWFQPGDNARDQGEAASIRQMVERIASDHGLDRARIFITGLSAGGAMTAAMLAAYPEIFAGGAIIAGLPLGSAANVPEALNSMRRAPLRPAEAWGAIVRQASSHDGLWPVISLWHGDADTTVHASNGEALIAQWTNVHGLPLKPTKLAKEGPHRRSIWQRKDGVVVLEAFDLSGMGHGTPIGGSAPYGEPGPFFLDIGISSTVRIASFWGLAGKDAVVAAPVRRSEAPVPLPETDKTLETAWTSTPKQGGGVKAVIVAALKAAGLLRK